MRALVQLIRGIAHVVRGLRIIRREFHRIDAAAREAHMARWSRQMLDLIGMDLQVLGTPPERGPVLLVANHISWLDILVMQAARPARFVSKADVHHWPVLGALIAGAGTLFIERERRRDAMRVVHQMTERLREGDVIAIFPEGTTSDGSGVLPFHANLLQAAISSGQPVQPVGLVYVDAATGQVSHAADYVGDDTLGASIWRVLRAPRLQARLNYGTPQPASGRERRQWAQDLHREVNALRRTASGTAPGPAPRSDG